MIVIVHGPQGDGKTRYVEQFLRHFGCLNAIDEWDGKTPLVDGDLALTNCCPPYVPSTALVIDAGAARSLCQR